MGVTETAAERRQRLKAMKADAVAAGALPDSGAAAAPAAAAAGDGCAVRFPVT